MLIIILSISIGTSPEQFTFCGTLWSPVFCLELEDFLNKFQISLKKKSLLKIRACSSVGCMKEKLHPEMQPKHRQDGSLGGLEIHA